MPEPRDSATRPPRQKKAARVATSPSRMPWPMRLVFLVCGLGLLSVAVLLIRMDTQIKMQCRVQEQLQWERMPNVMGKQLVDNAREDARLQEALDAQRQTSWWAWLMTPAHPPKRGCAAWGFF
jgi:hypothetical protein